MDCLVVKIDSDMSEVYVMTNRFKERITQKLSFVRHNQTPKQKDLIFWLFEHYFHLIDFLYLFQDRYQLACQEVFSDINEGKQRLSKYFFRNRVDVISDIDHQTFEHFWADRPGIFGNQYKKTSHLFSIQSSILH